MILDDFVIIIDRIYNILFVKELDFRTLRRVDRRGVSEYDKDKTTDVLWKIKYKGQFIYIGILIEVQSTNDNTMPIRFLDYIGLFYENQYQSLKMNEKIIPIIPILLYIGSENWNAKIKFHDLVNIPDESLNKFIPDFEYIPIILNDITKEKLTKAESMLTRLLSLNKSESLDDFRELSENIFNLILTFTDKTRQEKYSKHFLKYVQQVLGKKIDQKRTKEIIEDIEQGGDMFFVTLEHLFEDDKKALEDANKAKEKALKKEEKERKAKEKALKKIEKSVLKMLKKGLSVDEIADFLDLSKKEIEKIKKDNKV